MTTAVIAEDEPHIAHDLQAMLHMLWPELEFVAVAADGVTALAALREQTPDFAFLDVKMPGLNGIEVLQALGATTVKSVFITAFDDFAIPAFAEGVVDHIVKPVSIARLAKTVTRLQSALGNGQEALPAVAQPMSSLVTAARVPSPLRWIQASQGDKVFFITIDEVIFFQSDAKYTRVVTAKREAFIRRSVKSLQSELDSSVFLQIHRGTLVNTNFIEHVQRDAFRGMRLQLLQCKTILQVAQPYQAQPRGM